MPTLRAVEPPLHGRPAAGFPEDEAAPGRGGSSMRFGASVEEDLRLREEAASSELRRRADELRRADARAEARARDLPPVWGDLPRNVPGPGSLAREIAGAAVRLGVTLVTAPFRIAWSALRSKQE
jgi:hypothetical protein